MIDTILFFGVILSFLLAAMCLMVARLLFDMAGNEKKNNNIYMLKVDENGNMKIKRYRGNVKHWAELDNNDYYTSTRNGRKL